MSVTSVINSQDVAGLINVVSCSEEYRPWQSVEEPSNLSIINKPIRLSQAEFGLHPIWKDHITRDGQLPPYRNWLAVPLRANNETFMGSIQLYDKIGADFSSIDEHLLLQFAGHAAMAIERQQSIDKLKENELRFRILANSIPNMAWMAHADGNIYWYNNRWIDYTGLSVEKTKGWLWATLHHPDHVERAINFISDAWKRSQPFEIIHPLRDKDGNYRWFISRGTPILDNRGNILEWMGTLTDIDEQKRGEERFRQLANEAPLWIWLADRNGKVDYANRAMLNYFGFQSYSEISRSLWSTHLHPDDLHLLADVVTKAYQNQTSYFIECRMRRSIRSPYEWFSIQTVPRVIENVFDGLIGTAHNIDAQKNSQAKLELLVEDRTRQLNDTNTALRKTNEQLAQFAHIASHDLKEPVRKMSIYANRLNEVIKATGNERAKMYLSGIDDASRRMAELIEGILRFSSLTGEEHLHEYVDLNTTLANAMADLEIPIQLKKANVVIQKVLPVIEGVPILIYQLIYNLLNNALKFSKTEVIPLIEVTSRALREEEIIQEGLIVGIEYIMICVEDNGIGFDQVNAGKIFQKFARLNKRSDYEGTGLGLALCKRIVEDHNGKIEAESVLGEGAVFKIILPLQQP